MESRPQDELRLTARVRRKDLTEDRLVEKAPKYLERTKIRGYVWAPLLRSERRFKSVRLVPRPSDVSSTEGDQSSLSLGLRDASQSFIERIGECVQSSRGERVKKSIAVLKVVVCGARRHAYGSRHLANGQLGEAVIFEHGICRVEKSLCKISVVIAPGAHVVRWCTAVEGTATAVRRSDDCSHKA